MEDNKGIQILFNTLKDRDIWFTTKNDPTFEEPRSYYQLDEYGDPTPKTINQIIKEVDSYIGDGAIDIEDAIELWITDQAAAYRLGYIDNLVTKFKQKPVVDQIDAYHSSVQTEIKDLNEAKIIESEEANIDGMLTPIPKELFHHDKMSGWTQKEWKNYYDRFFRTCTEIYNGDASEYVKKQNLKGFAERFNLNDLKFEPDTIKQDIDKLSKAYANEKERRYKEAQRYTESQKRRLEEENSKSLGVITQMMQSKDFDADSPAGKIVLRTSEMFNQLSEKGHDVQVAFDNGESQSSILLGKQGGKVIITITSPADPITAYTSGNFELNNENLNLLSKIFNDIKNIK